LWQEKTKSRKLDCIIARVCGPDPEREGLLKMCILEYADKPAVVNDDVFYITQADIDKYFWPRYTAGSALVFVGDFEVQESLELKINQCTLIFYIEAGWGREYSGIVSLMYSIKSYHEKLKTQKLRDAEKLLEAAREEERQQQLIEQARKRIEEAAQRQLQVEAAKATIANESATVEERLSAIAFLERA
jgi:hypothetical protein